MRITAWDPILAGALTANDVLLIESLGTSLTKKLSLTELATYLFGGTLSTGIFVTLDGVMTMTNKRLTAPKVNSANATSVTSAELDILHGATLTTAELNLLTGLVAVADLASVQTFTNKTLVSPKMQGMLINNNTAWVEVTAKAEELNYLANLDENLKAWMTAREDELAALSGNILYSYSVNFGASATSTDITETTILTALGLTGKINHMKMTVWYAVDDTGGMKLAVEDSSGIEIIYKVTGSTEHLDKVTLTTVISTAYRCSIQFKLV